MIAGAFTKAAQVRPGCAPVRNQAIGPDPDRWLSRQRGACHGQRALHEGTLFFLHHTRMFAVIDGPYSHHPQHAKSNYRLGFDHDT